MPDYPEFFAPSTEIVRAQAQNRPIVALESTVITHGLPRPHNLSLARGMEQAVRAEGAIPATIAVLDGKIRLGLSPQELEQLANADSALKVSLRDFATALVKNSVGGTTVAGTMFAAHRAGIRVFATGGIGGVHVEQRFDISTDLKALAEIPMLVVCAGAKSVLDLDATLEYLETMGVPVIGYQTDRFPEFFSPGEKRPVSARLESPEEIVAFARQHWNLGLKSAVLVCQPVPADEKLDAHEADQAERKASQEASEKNIRGQKLTPFLLNRVNELTGGKSMRANLALLLNNARLAAQISRAMAASGNPQALA